MKQVWITKTGAPEVLKVRDSSLPETGKNQVRIQTRACGVNFADIMARLGLYPDAPKLPAVVGYEVSGVVDEVGALVKDIKKGDRVIAVTKFGGYSESVVVENQQVFSLPSHLSFEEGAAVPVNYLTAFQALIAMGRIEKNDRVLIHSSAGGVGLAAIDLCHMVGAEVIAIASESKHDFLRDKGVKKVIDSRKQDYEKEVLQYTSNEGVHRILDPVGGDSWAKGLRCLAPTGQICVFGLSAAANRKTPNKLNALKQLFAIPWLKCSPINLMNQNKGIYGVNLGHLWHKPNLTRAWALKILEFMNEKKLHPTVSKSFSFENAPKAHHFIQDRLNIGKVLLTP